jgi:hypothetical protein
MKFLIFSLSSLTLFAFALSDYCKSCSRVLLESAGKLDRFKLQPLFVFFIQVA